MPILYNIRLKLSDFRTYQALHNVKIRLIEKHKKHIALIPIKQKLKSNKNAMLYVFTPSHENLGDHAIACSTIELFNTHNFSYIEITDEELYLLNYYNSLKIFNGRKILITGGGNLGTLWPVCESISRKIVESNPKSEIIFLPNTIFYENTEEGMAELEKSKQIYNSHKNLVFYARERNSYEYMKRIHKNVRLCPDMVLSICKQDDSIKRNGCLVCLRNDIEKTLDQDEQENIIKQVKISFDTNYTIIDMYSPSYFDISKREEVLENKFQEFRSAQLVITDRLHGMIFSAITGTPCIVIDSKSPKVKGCYEWVKDLGYIRFCDDISKINDLIDELISLENCKYDTSIFSHYFSDLMKEISQ